jgi:hypothetical protein
MDHEAELANLNAAREVIVLACGKIPGMGPDFQKAANALAYIDRLRKPILEAMLAPEESEVAQ